ncbi:MAG: hypothetical protein ACM31D_16270 [Bacteroidota bacterium]
MTLRHTVSFAALPLAALFALSACTGMSLDEPAAAPAKPQASTSRPAMIAAPPPARPSTKPTPDLNALRPPPRPGAEHDSTATAGPPKLLGLSEEETVGLLGRPTEETMQPPSKVWIYRAAGCQLSVHLFPDMEKGGFYALDYAADGGRDLCLGKVAGEARKRGGALAEQKDKTG